MAGATGSADKRPPVASTVSKDGSLVPSVTSAGKGAVKDLVTGVTGTITDTTGKVITPGTPLDTVVGGLAGTLDNTTDELLPDQD